MAKLKEETHRVSDAAWVTLGMPFDSPMIEEKIDGIVDVEALIIATLLVMENDRLVTDLPAWINRFSGLISFQKLKTLFKGLSISHGKTVLANLGHDYFAQTPKGFRNAFGLQAKGRGAVGETIHRRTQKINSIENVGRFSIMIRNRLIYGTGFRADLITLLHIGNIDLRGIELAKLMCADNSTVSRILNDLKTSGFLNPYRRNESIGDLYPGMFLSVKSVPNLCELMDATQFSMKELTLGTLESLNFAHDAFGKRISKKVF